MKTLYRLKTLAWIGTVSIGTLVFWLIVAWSIPSFHVKTTGEQLYTIRHQDLRDNNRLYLDPFLNSIKQNNGYLVLGTSETNKLKKGGNYHDFLNSDTDLTIRFSVIAGAGRTACTYFPLIQGNANVENVKIIYYINPIYWTTQFSKNNREYFHRYLSYSVYRKANRPHNAEVDAILQANKTGSFWTTAVDWLEFAFNRAQRKYKQDLWFAITSSDFEKNLNKFPVFRTLNSYPHFGRIDSANYCFTYNMSDTSHLRTYHFQVDTSARYRYDELNTMVALCRQHKVDITFVIGPYNHKAFSELHPEEIHHFNMVYNQIRHILDTEGCPYVDASDLSDVAGVFQDWQHHSSYGAYLLYLKIKDYVLEKENR
jgi:hypothetical protein